MNLHLNNITRPLRLVRFIGESNIRYSIQPKQAFGKWIKTELNLLGPAFIKFGQFLSTRQDIFEKDIILELQQLQDDITPIPFDEIELLLSNHYNIPYNEIFKELDKIPIATASIGQVHRGKINNSEIVVKFQKPNITKRIEDDFITIKNIINLTKFLNNTVVNEFNNLIEQFEDFLIKELDYDTELQHMNNFHEYFKDSELKIKIPKVIKSLSSKTILVMEYIPSIKITNIIEMKKLNIDTAQVANNLIQIFLYQMITMGYVHCDPHPGNLGLYNDGETIVLYDYGNCIKFSNKFKKNLSQLIFSIYQRDVNEFVELMIELDILNIKDEYEILEVKSFFNYFFKYLENLDFNDLKKDIVKNDIKSGFQANLRINPSFLSLFRIFSLMDGTCSLLDKNFNYITAIGPYAQEIMNDVEFFNYRIKKDFSKIRSYPTIMQTNEGNILKLNKNISNINKDLQKTQIMVILLMISLYNINYSPFMFIIYVVYLINFK